MRDDGPAASRRHRGLLRVTAHVVLPLAVGFAMYVLWRPTNLWVFVWLDTAGLTDLVSGLRQVAAGIGESLPTAVLFNLPAACWTYSFCITIGLIWKDAPTIQWRTAVFTALAVGIAGEVAQLIPSIPGVFDLADCAADSVAGLAGIGVVSRFRGEPV